MESELPIQIASNSILCGSCERLYAKHTEFAIHHFQFSYICAGQKEVQTECEYWQHFREKDSTLFKCCFCPRSFTRRINIMEHIFQKHVSLLRYECQHCKENFSSFGTLAYHVCVNGVLNNNECLICHEVFQSKCALVKHQNRSHTRIVVPMPQKIPNTQMNDKEKQNANSDITGILSSYAFAKKSARMNSCRTDSSYYTTHQQHPVPHYMQQYPYDFSPISPHYSLQPQLAHSLQDAPQLIHPMFHPEMMHHMECNVYFNSFDDVYQNKPPNMIQQLEQNWPPLVLRNGGHFKQDGRISYPQSDQLVTTDIPSPQTDPGNILQYPLIQSVQDYSTLDSIAMLKERYDGNPSKRNESKSTQPCQE